MKNKPLKSINKLRFFNSVIKICTLYSKKKIIQLVECWFPNSKVKVQVLFFLTKKLLNDLKLETQFFFM